jgi:phospholipase C
LSSVIHGRSRDELTAALTNPGTYDLSLHGPNGFFRHFAGSPGTERRVEVHGDHRSGRLTLRVIDGNHHRDRRRRRPVVVEVADAYGPARKIRLDRGEEIAVDIRHAGGWYDIALTTPSDATCSYQLAGRLESPTRLTSDPQLGRSSPARIAPSQSRRSRESATVACEHPVAGL